MNYYTPAFLPKEALVFVRYTFKGYMDYNCPGYEDVLRESEIETLEKGYSDVKNWIDKLANTHKMANEHNKSGLDYGNTISKNKDRLNSAIRDFLIDFRRAAYAVQQAARKDQQSDLSEDSGSIHM